MEKQVTVNCDAEYRTNEKLLVKHKGKEHEMKDKSANEGTQTARP